MADSTLQLYRRKRQPESYLFWGYESHNNAPALVSNSKTCPASQESSYYAGLFGTATAAAYYEFTHQASRIQLRDSFCQNILLSQVVANPGQGNLDGTAVGGTPAPLAPYDLGVIGLILKLYLDIAYSQSIELPLTLDKLAVFPVSWPIYAFELYIDDTSYSGDKYPAVGVTFL